MDEEDEETTPKLFGYLVATDFPVLCSLQNYTLFCSGYMTWKVSNLR